MVLGGCYRIARLHCTAFVQLLLIGLMLGRVDALGAVSKLALGRGSTGLYWPLCIVRGRLVFSVHCHDDGELP